MSRQPGPSLDPGRARLAEMLSTMSYSAAGRALGVHRHTIAHWVAKHDLSGHDQGFRERSAVPGDDWHAVMADLARRPLSSAPGPVAYWQQGGGA